VLGVGGILSLSLFLTLRGWEGREVERRAADLAQEQVERLHVSVLRSMEVLHSIASLHAAVGNLGREQFQPFVQQALARQPELAALSWNPVVPHANRAEFEAEAARTGLTNFHFVELGDDGRFQPAQARETYVPVYLIEPLASNAAALGYDLNSDPRRHGALERARDTAQPMATAPISLAQGPANQPGILVLLPVYAGPPPATVVERRQQLAGFAVAVFRVHDLVREAFQSLDGKGIQARLFDTSPGGELLFTSATEAGGSVGGPSSIATLEVAGRNWAVEFAPTRALARAQSHFQSWLILAGGLLITALTAAYVFGGWRRTRQVAAANAALQEEVVERQRAEVEAEAANRAKSDFLASMSHEIRTPLNAILGYTQLMQREARLLPEQRDAVAAINASGRHLLGLINEILDLSKIEAGRMELNPVDFDLKTLADELTATFRPLCAEKRIRFRVGINGAERGIHAASTCELESYAVPNIDRAERMTVKRADARAPMSVHGDESKLRQVLINLLGNALKFTRAGEVFLGIKADSEGRWLFEVIDTGLGIPEDEHEQIFKPFHQGKSARHQGGTGLGLAIAHRQVALLGGALELQSERGFGSRFFFTLPLPPARADVEPAAAPPSVRLAPGQAVRVLVVDDHRENRDVLGGMLRQIGCEVWVAADAAEALAQTRAVEPAMVLLDLRLPDQSGTEVARRLLQDPSGCRAKIVMHTASALAKHRDEAMAAGCVDFIAKPVALERLCDCLERQLGVRFEALDSAVEADAHPRLGHQRVVLPPDLYARLTVAAELHSTTALKAVLQDLRTEGGAAAQLAEEIRHLMRSYDMDGIQKLLARAVLAKEAVKS
jgi:signal transduction histidine kinase/CheY-like chemotaxis protein